MEVKQEIQQHLHAHFLDGIVGVLVDDALGLLEVLQLGLLLPPVDEVAVLVELTSL